jgi:uncharacterized protein YndB with AHSA1/START domain
MAPVEMHMDVPPERVWAVLADPPTYSYWVVGARSVERHDPDWPRPGTRFEHTQGKWPLIIHDHTESVDADEPRRLEIIAKARPVLVARVVFQLTPERGGTRVVMEEHSVGGLLHPFANLPPNQQLTQWRNKESLRRVCELATGRKSV